jgi:hypothetical protein
LHERFKERRSSLVKRHLLMAGVIVTLAVMPLLPQGPTQGNPQGQRGAAPAVAVQRPGTIRGAVVREGTNEPLAMQSTREVPANPPRASRGNYRLRGPVPLK